MRSLLSAPPAAQFAVCAVAAICLLVCSQTSRPQVPTVLYTAPHAEVAPFSRVWNPDTNDDYTPKEFAKEGGENLVYDDLCGPDGSKCPELPAFNGEDYFDGQALGCCNNKEQQKVWGKWKGLRDEIAKLEGEVRYLRGVKQDVYLQEKKKAKIAALHDRRRMKLDFARKLKRSANRHSQPGADHNFGVPLPM